MRREDLNMGRRDFNIRREISMRINKILNEAEERFLLRERRFQYREERLLYIVQRSEEKGKRQLKGQSREIFLTTLFSLVNIGRLVE